MWIGSVDTGKNSHTQPNRKIIQCHIALKKLPISTPILLSMVHGNSRAMSSSRYRGSDEQWVFCCWLLIGWSCCHPTEVLGTGSLTAHGQHMLGGWEDIWPEEGRGGVKRLWNCTLGAVSWRHGGSVCLQHPCFQSSRLKRDGRIRNPGLSVVSVAASLASDLQCHCRGQHTVPPGGEHD